MIGRSAWIGRTRSNQMIGRSAGIGRNRIRTVILQSAFPCVSASRKAQAEGRPSGYVPSASQCSLDAEHDGHYALCS